MFGQILWINGRNNRFHYWMINLATTALVFIVLGDVFVGVYTNNDDLVMRGMAGVSTRLIILGPLIWWLTMINSIRRNHDRNKSGLWSLLIFVPFVGMLWEFVDLGLIGGTNGDNDYGPPPGSAQREAALDIEIAALANLTTSGNALPMIEMKQPIQPLSPSSAIPSHGRPTATTFGKRK